MAEQIERSAEQFAELAVSNTAEWLKLFLREEASRSIDEDDADDEDYFNDVLSDVVGEVDDWESIQPFHGLKLYLVYREGGTEGGGEHVEVVYAVAPPNAERVVSPDGDIIEGALTYFRLTGYYSSDEGTEMDDITDIVTVYPREVTVIRFFKKGQK